MDTSDSTTHPPALTPEEKVHMALDDIIKREKINLAISQNLTRKRYSKKSQQWRFSKKSQQWRLRRFKSQQWRLGRNGPNTPRWRKPQRNFYNSPSISSFLAHKQATAAPSSVFHRLGWNPRQYAAARLAHQAKWHFSPFFKPFRYRPVHDPTRFQKILAAQKIYRQQNGLAPVLQTSGRFRPLNELNLKQLGEALGGQITSVKENISPEGSVVTTITRKSNFSHPSPFVEELDLAVQNMIAAVQQRPFMGNSSALFEPRKFEPLNAGLPQRFTPHTTGIPTCKRFPSQPQLHFMDIS